MPHRPQCRERMYAAGPRMQILPTKPASMLSASSSPPQNFHHRKKTGSHMEFSSEVLTLIGTLGGVLIGAVTTVATTYIAKRSEDRKHLQQIAMQTAVESWRATIESGSYKYVPPLSHYLINATLICKLIDEKRLTPERVAQRAEEVSGILRTLEANAFAATAAPMGGSSQRGA